MKWNPKDKLYVNPYGWNSKPSRSDEVEYIRKDTILELLQNRNKEIYGTSKAFFRSQELQEIYWRINEL